MSKVRGSLPVRIILIITMRKSLEVKDNLPIRSIIASKVIKPTTTIHVLHAVIELELGFYRILHCFVVIGLTIISKTVSSNTTCQMPFHTRTSRNT